MSDVQTKAEAPVIPPGDAPMDTISVVVLASEKIASFRGEFFIHSEKRITALDQGPVRAYAASGLNDVSQVTHYAMVCEPHLIPRSRLSGSFAGILNPNLARLVASGPTYWPPAKAERYLFIYENPQARPLMVEGQFRGLDMKPELVEAAIVKPLTFVLMDLRDADVVHGNIRPSNMYAVGAGNNIDRVILGECLSTPPSYNQHVMFETIERGMADPVARGLPNIEHDLYALGVSLAVLLRSRDPMEGMTNEQIIRHKIENGSYIALTGKDRFTGTILELLRGLLNDDRAQRWTIDDVASWLEGQRLNPKTGTKKIKAARPIHFQNERYLRPALLAMDLNDDQTASAQLVESGALEQWVSRSLEDPLVEKRLESALETVAEYGRGPGYWDRLLCRVAIALDPEAPIRYKGLVVHPEGVGDALAQAMTQKTDIQPYIDLINQQTVMFWLTSQGDTLVDVGLVVSRFDSCRAFLRQTSIAYGIERCLYFLNPEAPCISDKLVGYYVRNPEDLMVAFDKIAANPKRPELFFDRHTIAFLSVKDRKDIDPYLIELNAEEMYKRVMGNIKTLATIQQRAHMQKFPGICRWISEILEPVYERYHDRELRKSMKAKIASLVDKGDIAKIAVILDSAQTTQKDAELYHQARVDYYKLRVEDATLESKLADPVQFNLGIGREVAAITACILAGLTILFFVFMVFTKGGIF